MLFATPNLVESLRRTFPGLTVDENALKQNTSTITRRGNFNPDPEPGQIHRDIDGENCWQHYVCGDKTPLIKVKHQGSLRFYARNAVKIINGTITAVILIRVTGLFGYPDFAK